MGSLTPGTGKAQLSFGITGSMSQGSLMGGLDYQHRLKRGLSLYGTAQTGLSWDPTKTQLYYKALAGLRWEF